MHLTVQTHLFEVPSEISSQEGTGLPGNDCKSAVEMVYKGSLIAKSLTGIQSVDIGHCEYSAGDCLVEQLRVRHFMETADSFAFGSDSISRQLSGGRMEFFWGLLTGLTKEFVADRVIAVPLSSFVFAIDGRAAYTARNMPVG